MPYRRLPKTDKARIEALKRAVETRSSGMTEEPISFALIQRAEILMPQFINNVVQYNFFYKKRVEGNQEMKKTAAQARMYLSHFMQVLMMAFERGDIKRVHLSLYGFDDIPETLPRLISYEELEEVGKRMIEGEQKRVMQGGIAINCPTVQVVNVFYQKFREALFALRNTAQSTDRNQQMVKNMRDQIDELLLNIWDEIEAFYADRLPYERMKCCQRCGVIYYYHKGEKELSPESDLALKNAQAAQEEVVLSAECSEPISSSEESFVKLIEEDDAEDQSLF